MTEIQYIAVLESEKRQLETFKASVDSTIKGLERKIEELEEQNKNLQIMLKAEREVRCNEDYLKSVCELEKENERLTVSYETLKLHDEEEIGILKSENAELKVDNDARKFAMAMSEKVEKHLREQLTKAKEIIRQFLNDYPVITKELLDKLEQFIKEIEKCQSQKQHLKK